MITRCLPALLTLSTLACAAPSPGSPTLQRLESGQTVRIVCFGDSITGVYYHTGGRRAWGELLGATLQQRYPKARIELINAGISGHTTADALKRMEADVLRHQPHLVVAMFGMNDTARLSPGKFRANLGEIVHRTRSAGSELLLLTPNAVHPGDSARPPEKVAAFAALARAAGRELQVPVADVFAAFSSIQAREPGEWVRLMSDTIHPNLRGHALIAATAAQTLTGQTAPAVVPRAPAGIPPFAQIRAKLQSGQPLRVLAMIPVDALIGPALRRLYPGARVEVTACDTAGKNLGELEAAAKEYGWFKYRAQPELTPPDLVVVAVPATAGPAANVPYYRTYGSILNWSQWFDGSGWECVVVLPSIVQPALTMNETEREQIALAAAQDKDLPVMGRRPGENGSAEELLAQKLREWIEASSR